MAEDTMAVEDTMALLDRETDLVVMEPGQVLFRKGEAGRLMYIVKSGEVQIVDSNRVLETVRPGGILGEMALVDGRPRSATAQSFDHSTVIPIDEDRFLFLVQHTPFFAIRVMRVMSARLRITNERAMILPG
jgi:CRP/FNR family transcriptional regulator, cyclic AMP receptor protein